MVQKRLVRYLILLLALVCGPGQAREPLRLAMSGAFQPFSSIDAQGNLSGFDADIARALAGQMGRQAVLIQIDWSGIQAGLQSGKYDLICGSMAITPERQERMLFSLPYYVSGAQVFSLSGRPPTRFGVTEDSTYSHYIQAHPDQFGEAEVVFYGSEAEILAAIRADKVDGFVSDQIVGGFYLSKSPELQVERSGPLLYREACGIAARSDDRDLIKEVNQALLALIQSGEYQRIYHKWVGQDPDLKILLESWGDFPPSPKIGSPQAKAKGAETRVLALLLAGAQLTIVLSLLTGIISLITGTVLGVASISPHRLTRTLASGYVMLIRGTPLLVQLFLSYFLVATAVNRWWGEELMGAFSAALLALIVNTTAYNGETLRGGIGSVEKGQWEAALSLGMRRFQILTRIVLPQAFRNSLSSLGNNLVVLIKDTSLVGAITLIELTYAARNVVFQTGEAFTPFLLAAVFYLIIISTLSAGIAWWERRMSVP